MSKIYVKKEGDNFKVFEDDNFIGFAEAKKYPKIVALFFNINFTHF